MRNMTFPFLIFPVRKKSYAHVVGYRICEEKRMFPGEAPVFSKRADFGLRI